MVIHDLNVEFLPQGIFSFSLEKSYLEVALSELKDHPATNAKSLNYVSQIKICT